MDEIQSCPCNFCLSYSICNSVHTEVCLPGTDFLSHDHKQLNEIRKELKKVKGFIDRNFKNINDLMTIIWEYFYTKMVDYQKHNINKLKKERLSLIF